MADDRPPHHTTEYDRAYERTPEVLAKQRARMYARYHMVKKYGEAVLKGKDIDHEKPLAAGGGNDPSNWRIRDAHDNRADKTVFKKPGYHPVRI
jgi:hypothetical protein